MSDVSVDAQSKNTMKTCRLIDFDVISVNPGILADTWFLTVSGTKSTESMKVELRANEYNVQPEYWEVEVVGCVPQVNVPRSEVFSEILDMTGRMGTKGIKVIGDSKVVYWPD